MSARWYKRCGADFIHGTMSLTLEEKGAYSLCLDLIYDRGGPIPDDSRWLSGVCGVSIRKWNSLRQSLISAGKIYVSEGLLSNVRADFELVSSELQRRNQAESGAKGGRKSVENRSIANKNNNLDEATLKPIEEIRREEILSKDNKGAYAFCGKIIRLSQKDFNQWQSSYPDIDLRASLQSRDDWICGQDGDAKKRWFNSTSNWLAIKQREARKSEKLVRAIC